MNIAIIGAGFYGCHFALTLAKHFNNCNIDIYEKNSVILNNAISNNQHRLHLGYHYPRCPKTIEQAIRSHDKFISEYPSAVEIIKNNLYIVHKNSNVNYEQYRDTFYKFNLKLEEVKLNTLTKYLINTSDFDGAIKTEEKKINLSNLKEIIISRLNSFNNIRIIKNCNIQKITQQSEILFEQSYKKYDFVINTTYYDPSLGLHDKQIETKSELCFLTLLEDKNKKFEDVALTICDGEFASLYPADRINTFTLSNVKLTPFFKDILYKNLIHIKESLNKQQIDNINKLMFEDSKKYFSFFDSDFNILRTYVTIKTKILNDSNDYRGSYYVRENNNISFMCGKISAALDLQDSLIEEIEK